MKMPNNKILKLGGVNTQSTYRVLFLNTLDNIEANIIRLLFNKYKDYSFITNITSNIALSRRQLSYVVNIRNNFDDTYLIAHLDKMLIRITKEYVEAMTDNELYSLASRCTVLRSYIRALL